VQISVIRGKNKTSVVDVTDLADINGFLLFLSVLICSIRFICVPISKLV